MKKILKSKGLGYLQELDWILTRFESNGLTLAEARQRVLEVREEEHKRMRRGLLIRAGKIMHEQTRCPKCPPERNAYMVPTDDGGEGLKIIECKKCRYSEVI